MTAETVSTAIKYQQVREVAFFAADVPDMQTLIDGLRPGVAYHVLSPEGDGLAEIATHLAGYRDLEALHIVSHGAPGTVYLGNTVLSASTFESPRAKALLAIQGQALAAEGCVLVYGCEVAKGARGRDFLAHLESMLGRPVAASETPTGAADKGGDWRFPIAGFGPLNPDAMPDLFASSATFAAYQGILMPTFDFESNNTGETAIDGQMLTHTVTGISVMFVDPRTGGDTGIGTFAGGGVLVDGGSGSFADRFFSAATPPP